jgi:hypothetical protein
MYVVSSTNPLEKTRGREGGSSPVAVDKREKKRRGKQNAEMKKEGIDDDVDEVKCEWGTGMIG